MSGPVLKPCPFCGRPTRMVSAADVFWVECESCSATQGRTTPTREGVAADWNRRTTRTDWAAGLVYAAEHALSDLATIRTLQDDSTIEELALSAECWLASALDRARREKAELETTKGEG